MFHRGAGVRGFAKGKAFVVEDCGQRNPYENLPSGCILVAASLSLSDSALIDFRKVVGLVTESPDHDGQVCVLARGIGIPAIIGIQGCTKMIVTGDRLIIRNLDLLVNPDLEAVNGFERMRTDSDDQLSLDL